MTAVRLDFTDRCKTYMKRKDSLCVDLRLGITKSYLLPPRKRALIVAIDPHGIYGRWGQNYTIEQIPWLLKTLWDGSPWHQQQWYWRRVFEVFFFRFSWVMNMFCSVPTGWCRTPDVLEEVCFQSNNIDELRTANHLFNRSCSITMFTPLHTE